MTDLHYADKPPGGSRHYRDSVAKMAAAGQQFAQAKTDVVIELGDFIDSADTLEAEKGFLQRIQAELSKLPGPRHYVLGNHCVSALTKPEFLEIVGQTSSYYSFDLNKFHFVILDACFRSDGVAYERNNFNWADSYVPQAELEWLRKDLHAATGPALVFVHQCLDVEPPYGIKNAAEVRQTAGSLGPSAGGLSGASSCRRLPADQPHPLLHATGHGRGPRPGRQRVCGRRRPARRRIVRERLWQADQLPLAPRPHAARKPPLRSFPDR